MKNNEFEKLVNEYIEKYGINNDSNDIDYIAETLTDDIAATHEITTDANRDKLVNAIYNVLRG